MCRFNKKMIGVFPLFITVLLSAQTAIIDSILREIVAEKNQQKKLNELFLLCDQFNSLSPDTLLSYYETAKLLAEKMDNKLAKRMLRFIKQSILLKKQN